MGSVGAAVVSELPPGAVVSGCVNTQPARHRIRILDTEY